MALNITDVQLTKLFIAAEGTAVTTPAEIATAISTADLVSGIQSIGEVMYSRNTTEYSAIDTDETAYSSGSITISPIDLSVLFDSTDTAGQAELRTMMGNNSRRVFIIKLTDDLAVSPSYLTFTGFLSKSGYPIEKDGAVLYNTIVQPSSVPVLTEATAV